MSGLKISSELVGMDRTIKAAFARIEVAELAGVTEGGAGLKEELRDETYAVYGGRVAKSWQGRIYPNKGDANGAAALVFSKAPKLIAFASADQTVRAARAKYLAIPTDAVPTGTRKRKLSPRQVEERFGKTLRFEETHSGKGGVLILDRLVQRGMSGRFRNASDGKRARGNVESVVMFVLVRFVRGRKRIDVDAAADRWGAKTVAAIEQHLEASA